MSIIIIIIINLNNFKLLVFYYSIINIFSITYSYIYNYK